MPSTNLNAWFTPCVRIVKWATILSKNHDFTPTWLGTRDAVQCTLYSRIRLAAIYTYMLNLYNSMLVGKILATFIFCFSRFGFCTNPEDPRIPLYYIERPAVNSNQPRPPRDWTHSESWGPLDPKLSYVLKDIQTLLTGDTLYIPWTFQSI